MPGCDVEQPKRSKIPEDMNVKRNVYVCVKAVCSYIKIFQPLRALWLLCIALLSTFKVLRLSHTVYFCVMYGFHNKQRLFPCITFTDWFFLTEAHGADWIGLTSRSQWPRGLRRNLWPLTCWDCGFESHRGHGCLLWVLCVVRWKSLRRADHSSRGLLPSVMRRWVWSRSLVNEEVIAQWGLLCQKKKD